MAKKIKDIVERLRQGGDCADGCEGRCQECPDDRQKEAATEIERLRTALETIADPNNHANWGTQVFAKAILNHELQSL